MYDDEEERDECQDEYHGFGYERGYDECDATFETCWAPIDEDDGGEVFRVEDDEVDEADAIVEALSRIAMRQERLPVALWLQRFPEADAVGTSFGAAVNTAAAQGRLDVVQFLHKNAPDHLNPFDQWLRDGPTTFAMNRAAANGHLDVVQWLHEHRSEGCTYYAMDAAAINGHADMVRWLHENRHEGCSALAMTEAARMGHLDIVQFLHAHRTEGCSPSAMDCAAVNGHLDVVKWLHANRTEGFTSNALDVCAGRGMLEMAQWLHAHRPDARCTRHAMEHAASGAYWDAVRWLHVTRPRGCVNDVSHHVPSTVWDAWIHDVRVQSAAILFQRAWRERRRRRAATVIQRAWREVYYAPGATGAVRAAERFVCMAGGG